MEQAGKNTILLVRGTAAEPVGLSAFAAAQPDVQVQTVSGLDEARTALGRQLFFARAAGSALPASSVFRPLWNRVRPILSAGFPDQALKIRP